MGKPPSFLILDEDPRESFEVLLDTATYVRFAVHEGAIVKNVLPQVADVEPEANRSGWIAYTPPPMALPLTYEDTSKWNRWESRYFSGIFLSAVVRGFLASG